MQVLATTRPVQPVARPAPLRKAQLAPATAAAAAPCDRGARQSPFQAAAAAGAALMGKAAAGCLAALLLTGQPAMAKEVIQGFPRVVDGDTLDFSGTRVRLFGIDAPETKQSCKAAKGAEYLCGERSKQALAEKIGKTAVQCEQKNRDKYGRVVGICSMRGEDLNGWMVQEGLAVAYRQYSKSYVPLEDAARAASKGIWSGSFEVPQQWRIDNPRGGGGGSNGKAAAVPALAAGAAIAPLPQPVAAARAGGGGGAGSLPPAGSGCAIKGNITAKGDKIYHVPGGAYYERTKIELDQGERFFCTAAEAEAAGWRAARS